MRCMAVLLVVLSTGRRVTESTPERARAAERRAVDGPSALDGVRPRGCRRSAPVGGPRAHVMPDGLESSPVRSILEVPRVRDSPDMRAIRIRSVEVLLLGTKQPEDDPLAVD